MRYLFTVAAVLMPLHLAFAVPGPSTVEAVTRGMTCTQNPVGSMECEYRVGRSLHFAVVGVGDSDGAITFYSVSMAGDYYASVTVVHPCVIVKPGEANKAPLLDLAFVSPRTGKVYTTWQACEGAR
jgi:hypothetical protein